MKYKDRYSLTFSKDNSDIQKYMHELSENGLIQVTDFLCDAVRYYLSSTTFKDELVSKLEERKNVLDQLLDKTMSNLAKEIKNTKREIEEENKKQEVQKEHEKKVEEVVDTVQDELPVKTNINAGKKVSNIFDTILKTDKIMEK